MQQRRRNVCDPLPVRKDKDLVYRRIIISSDVLKVVKAVNVIEDWSINLYFNDILFLMYFFETIKFTHIRRKFNEAAYLLAKFSFV